MKYLFVIPIVCFVAVAGAIAYSAEDTGTVKIIAKSEKVLVYVESIRELGSKSAYDKFASAMKNQSLNVAHSEAHNFGSALFAVAGDAGLPTCDSRFSFGCYHEFLASAIDTNGLSSVGRLNQACKDALGSNYLSCQHGIGHGILTSVGYSEEDLLKALEVCHELPDEDIVGGCYGGVFMEYNMRTMWGEDAVPRASARPEELGSEARPKTFSAEKDFWQDAAAGGDADLMRPCNILGSEYLRACVYWQPQWWDSEAMNRGISTDESFVAMGKRCASYTGEVRTSCFGGMGNQMPVTREFSIDKGYHWCDIATLHATDFADCLNTQANSVSVSMTEKEGEQLCALAKNRQGFDSEECLKYAHNHLTTMTVQGFGGEQ